MICFVRNPHPKRTVYLPIGPGWCRVLRPAVATSVPAALLHSPAVRQLLLHRMIDVVDGAAWNADTRQARANRTDWARAIAAAEQVEFDKLRAGVVKGPPRQPHRPPKVLRPRKRRIDEWTPEQVARLRQRWIEGASGPEIAAELGCVSAAAVNGKAGRLGLPERRRPHSREVRTPETAKAV